MRLRIELAFAAVFLAACPAPTRGPARLGPDVETPDPCDGHSDVVDAISAGLDRDVARDGTPAAALAIVLGNCVFTRAVGHTKAGGDAGVHTRFQLASMTKTLTALTALSLEEDGVVDRSLPVSTYVETSSTATLDDVLAHRSGYPVELPDMSSLDLAQFADANKSAPMWAPPEEVFLYSNAGFALAGLALENAAGASTFEELVDERVFAPAGMVDARMGAAVDAFDDTFAHGNTGDPSAPDDVPPSDEYLTSTFYGPMGGAWASADDMGHFLKALLDDDIVTHASFVDMTTSRGATDYGAAIGYGQGMFVLYDGSLFHDGGVAGFVSEMDIYPEAHAAVAVLTNDDWGFPQEALSAAQAAFAPKSPPPYPDDIDYSDDDVAGSYADADGLGDFTIAKKAGGGLEAQFSSFTSTLEPLGPGVFGMDYPPWGGQATVSIQDAPSSGERYFVCNCGIAVRSESP